MLLVDHRSMYEGNVMTLSSYHVKGCMILCHLQSRYPCIMTEMYKITIQHRYHCHIPKMVRTKHTIPKITFTAVCSNEYLGYLVSRITLYNIIALYNIPAYLDLVGFNPSPL